ncbi:MAG: thiamine pyrophosphate-binding protein [Chloroflexi bacterium]|nr:thiamine pyrophosphate-binding protein [Chloroflexota bacterium]
MAIVRKYRGKAVVLPTMRANGAWASVSTNNRRDIPTGGSMGKTSSMGLGLALARPDVKVIVFDGDGSLEMNIGSLATIAGKRPKNLYHFVLQNGVYATTGGQPIPARDKISFAGMAAAAGYAASYYFDDLEEFSVSAERILEQEGPVFVCVRVVPDIRTNQMRGEEAAGPRRTPRQVLQEVKEELAAS